MTRRHLSLLCAAGALSVAAAVVASRLAAGLLALAAVLCLNYVDLWRLVRSPVAKRIIRTLPFLAPLTHWRPALDAGPAWAWLACVVPVLGWHLASRRAITAALRGARFFPPVTGEERAGMVYLQAASGPVQEYLHRGVLLGALAPALGPAAVAATTVTFVAEHVLTSGPKGARRRRDVAVWIAISALFGTTVHLAPEALWAAMVGHFLVNLPNVAQWALVPGERRVTSGAT